MEATVIGIEVPSRSAERYKAALTEKGFNILRVIILQDNTLSNIAVKIAPGQIVELSRTLESVSKIR